MNQKARALLRKITFLFILLGFIDYVVAYGLPHWAKYTTTAGQIHRYGLFMTCIEDFIKSECDTFHIESVDGSWVGFVQAMSSLGLFFYFISTGTGFLQFYWEYRKKRRLLYGSAITGILAGLLLSIAAYSFAYNNTGSKISLEYGFFMAIISIVPVVMCSFLNLFNAALVRTSKKRKHLGSGFDIRQHMFDFSVKPPVGTHLKDHVQISEDEYEEYLRPNTRQGKKSQKKPPPNFDYFNEMLDELMDDDSKQTETTTDGGSSCKKEEADDSKKIIEEEMKESDEISKRSQEEIQENISDVEEEKQPKSETPPVRSGVSFNDFPVVFTDRVQKTKPAKSANTVDKQRQLAHEMRMAQKNNRIAIMKVTCKKCPFEHTVTKLVEDLKTEDYPKIVKYVEGPEYLSFHLLGDRCLHNKVMPIKQPSKLSHKEELMLKASALQALPKIRKQRLSKMISPRVDVVPKKKKINKIAHVDEGKSSVSKLSFKQDGTQSEEDENMEKIIDEIDRTMDNQSKLSSIYIDTSLKMVEKANRPPSQVIFDEEEIVNESTQVESIKEDGGRDENEKNDEDESLKETIDDILKDDEGNNETEVGAVADNEEEATSEEEIIDDAGHGPGLSDNESETDLDVQTDGDFPKTNPTQPSAKTYSSGNATSALYHRPLVSFDDPKTSPSVKKKKKKHVKRAKTSFPKIDMSLEGRSHKSASLTKQRRANKEQRIAIVHDRCRKCCYELSVPKYEEDLTKEEKNKVEFIIDRSKSAKN